MRRGTSFRILIMLMLLCSMLACVGCGKEAAAPTQERMITDLAGREVKIPDEINNLVIVPVPWASVVYAVDGTGERIAGMHPSAKKAYEMSILTVLAPDMADVPTDFVGQDFSVHMEELGRLHPSAVIMWDYQEDEIKQLEKMNIPAIAIKYGTMEDLQNGIRLIGKVLKKEDRADALIQFQNDTMAYFDGKKSVLQGQDPPKVLYLHDGDLKVAAGASVNTMMIETAGGVNAAKEVQGQWTPVTMEQVAAWDPDIIILSNFAPIQPDDLYQDKLTGQNWKNIKAVREGRVWKAPVGLYRWDAPSIETPLMIKWLAQKIRPDVFTDYVLADDMRAFYNKFFSYQLTDDDLKRIFHE